MYQVLGPLYQGARPRSSFASWPGAGLTLPCCCNHLGSEPEDGISLCLSFFPLYLCLSNNIKIHKHIKTKKIFESRNAWIWGCFQLQNIYLKRYLGGRDSCLNMKLICFISTIYSLIEGGFTQYF